MCQGCSVLAGAFASAVFSELIFICAGECFRPFSSDFPELLNFAVEHHVYQDVMAAWCLRWFSSVDRLRYGRPLPRVRPDQGVGRTGRTNSTSVWLFEGPGLKTSSMRQRKKTINFASVELCLCRMRSSSEYFRSSACRGQMETAVPPTDVSWLQSGVIPGSPGSGLKAVILDTDVGLCDRALCGFSPTFPQPVASEVMILWEIEVVLYRACWYGLMYCGKWGEVFLKT